MKEPESKTADSRGDVVSAGAHASPKTTDALVRSLGELLKPESIRAVKVIRSEEGMASGFVLTNCPTEGQDHWKDFEVHFEAEGGPVDYAVVDGRRLTEAVRGDRAGGSKSR